MRPAVSVTVLAVAARKLVNAMMYGAGFNVPTRLSKKKELLRAWEA